VDCVPNYMAIMHLAANGAMGKLPIIDLANAYIAIAKGHPSRSLGTDEISPKVEKSESEEHKEEKSPPSCFQGKAGRQKLEGWRTNN
jgi:hypothetical protein